METPELKDLNPEQKKEILKILSKARFRLCAITIKFALGLFSANFISFLIGKQILKDVDPDQQAGFQIASMFLNAIFMVIYLNRQTKANSDIVSTSIKEVLKK